MKALILTVSTGGGHNSAALAVHEEFKSRGVECATLDVCYHVNEILGFTVSKGYLLSVDVLAKSYSKVYKRLEKRKKNAFSPIVGSFSLLATRLLGFISEFSPDVIVCTHVFAALALKHLRSRYNIRAKAVGIVTDFTVHPFWEDVTELDYLVIPSKHLEFQCLKKGFRKEQLLPYGIPLKKSIQSTVTKAEARSTLGLYPDKKVITVMGGSMGHGGIAETVKSIDKLSKCFQIIAVCGSSEREYKELCNSKMRHRTLKLSYTDKISLILDATDCLITKPGGLSVSEALAKGVPMILTNPIPGHEERNETFITNLGAAARTSNQTKIDEVLWQLLSDGERLENMARIGKANGHPFSAKALVDKLITDNNII